MYCNDCGAYLPDNANICTNCGARVEMAYVETYAPVPVDHNAYKSEFDKSDIGLNILSWFVPIFGIIYYFIKRNDFPKKAKGTLKSALISTVVSLVFAVGFVAIAGITVNLLKNKVSSELNEQVSEYNEYYDNGYYNDNYFTEPDDGNEEGDASNEDNAPSEDTAIPEDNDNSHVDSNSDSFLGSGEVKNNVYVNEQADIRFDLSDGWTYQSAGDSYNYGDFPTTGFVVMKNSSVGMFLFLNTDGENIPVDTARNAFIQSYQKSLSDLKVSGLEERQFGDQYYECVDVSGKSNSGTVNATIAIRVIGDDAVIIIAAGSSPELCEDVFDNIESY